MWSEIYNQSNQPTIQNIKDFVNCGLWDELCSFIQKTYAVVPKLEYSKCSMQKGWNIKYRKGRKSICTLYPMEDYFIVLIVIGEKEQSEAELLIPTCSTYIQQLFYQATPSSCGRWLMIEVTEKPILEDVLKLIQIRIKT